MYAKSLSLVLVATALVWVGCSSDDDHGHAAADAGTGHTSPYPSCNEITTNCHEVDVGEGPIHDCHDLAHSAKSEADCAPRKVECLRICAEAKADAGITDDDDDHDGGHG